MLLLPEKEKYPPLSGVSGEFYQCYKKAIDEKINQVIVEFAITKEEIINYIETTGVSYEEKNYEHDKIWMVFCEGFNVVQWGNMYHKDATPEKLHNDCSGYWHRETLPDYLLEAPIKQTNPKKRTRKRRKKKNIYCN